MAPDRDNVRKALDAADLNAVRIALYQATSDPGLLQLRTEATPVRGGSVVQTTIVPEDQEKLKSKVISFLEHQAASFVPSVPDDAQLKLLMENFTGEQLTDREFEFRKPYAAFDEFPREAHWTAGAAPGFPEGFDVAVIGAGFSGIAMGVALDRLGIPYTIFERRPEVGGTWSVNRYPDVRVDTMNFTYQFSFEKNYPWSEYFARQREVRGYIEHVARKYGVYEHIQFDSDMTRAEFDEKTVTWSLEITGPSGQRTRKANFVVSCAGLFSTANKLQVPGVDEFAGEILHTTEWTDGTTVAGKRVAVIGNGSTGVQILSAIAREAAQVYVVQRTPQWISPRERYGDPIPEETRWLLDTIPYYWNWFCYGMLATTVGKDVLQEPDREWQQAGGAVNLRNDQFRQNLIKYLMAQVEGRQDLVEKLIPDYPPMARRLVVDNGWYKSLLRENVELVSGSIERLEGRTIVFADGSRREVDLIIAATGFKVSKYLWPAEYRGIGGVKLEDLWSTNGGPRAYLGMTVPEFPNMFMLYGPNSQARGGALISWIEVWARYVAEGIISVVELGRRGLSVKQDVFEEYNRKLDERSESVLWTDDSVKDKNYYVNEFGRQQVNAPWRAGEYYDFLKRLNPVDFDYL